jgi:polar amino acid transport system substrate-binding protein
MSSRTIFHMLITSSLMLATASTFAAEPIRLCVALQPLPSFLYPNKEGSIQILIRMAAEQAGLQIKYEALPLPKCVEEMKAGNIQGSSAMGFTPQNQEFAVFPKKGSDMDSSKAVATARSSVYRLKASKADWNGKTFSNINQPILFAKGNSVITEKLKALKVPFNDDTLHFQKNLMKMISGQGDLVIGLQLEGHIRMAEPEFAGKIEELPTPFTEAHYFLSFSKKYYETNAAQVENLWTAISKMKSTPAYLAAIKGLN